VRMPPSCTLQFGPLLHCYSAPLEVASTVVGWVGGWVFQNLFYPREAMPVCDSNLSEGSCHPLPPSGDLVWFLRRSAVFSFASGPTGGWLGDGQVSHRKLAHRTPHTDHPCLSLCGSSCREFFSTHILVFPGTPQDPGCISVGLTSPWIHK